MKQTGRRIFEGGLVVSGILIFALFIHFDSAIRIFAFPGLILSAYAIHYASRGSSILKTAGLKKGKKGLFLYLLFAIVIGSALGIVVRQVFDLTLLPTVLTVVALIAPVIGISEELVFRGFIQGHLRPSGRLLSMLFATAGHTLYKFVVIASLPDTALFDFQFLILWTFVGGLLFSIVRELSGSVYPSAIAHGCFDIILYGGYATLPFWAWS